MKASAAAIRTQTSAATDSGAPRRVLIVGPLPPPAGGMANQTEQLVRLLNLEGLAVRVVQTNIAYRPDWVARWRGVRAMFRLMPYIIALWRSLADAQIVHVMANSGWSWHLFAAPAILLARLRRVPVVVNYRGGEAEPFLRTQARVVLPIMRRAQALVVPSAFLQALFERYRLRAEIVPNVVDLTLFAPAPNRPAGQHVVITRNLEPIYDIATALRAFAILRRRYPLARMTVAGTGPLWDELQSLAWSLGLGDAVRFAGRLDRSAVAALYREADVLLNPSRVDNMPNSLLEAMASGVPIVSTNVGGVPYLVAHEKTALLVPPADAEAMAEAIARCFDDEALRIQLVTAALQKCRAYSWEQVRPQLLALYRRCAGPMESEATA